MILLRQGSTSAPTSSLTLERWRSSGSLAWSASIANSPSFAGIYATSEVSGMVAQSGDAVVAWIAPNGIGFARVQVDSADASSTDQ